MAARLETARRLVSYDDLQELGVRFTRIHLRRLERAGLFPMYVTIGGGNSIAWFLHEVEAYLDRLDAARTGTAPARQSAPGPGAKPKRVKPKTKPRPVEARTASA